LGEEGRAKTVCQKGTLCWKVRRGQGGRRRADGIKNTWRSFVAKTGLDSDHGQSLYYTKGDRLYHSGGERGKRPNIAGLGHPV